jgi:hypothetical protein
MNWDYLKLLGSVQNITFTVKRPCIKHKYECKKGIWICECACDGSNSRS